MTWFDVRANHRELFHGCNRDSRLSSAFGREPRARTIIDSRTLPCVSRNDPDGEYSAPPVGNTAIVATTLRHLLDVPQTFTLQLPARAFPTKAIAMSTCDVRAIMFLTNRDGWGVDLCEAL